MRSVLDLEVRVSLFFFFFFFLRDLNVCLLFLHLFYHFFL